MITGPIVPPSYSAPFQLSPLSARRSDSCVTRGGTKPRYAISWRRIAWHDVGSFSWFTHVQIRCQKGVKLGPSGMTTPIFCNCATFEKEKNIDKHWETKGFSKHFQRSPDPNGGFKRPKIFGSLIHQANHWIPGGYNKQWALINNHYPSATRFVIFRVDEESHGQNAVKGQHHQQTNLPNK